MTKREKITAITIVLTRAPEGRRNLEGIGPCSLASRGGVARLYIPGTERTLAGWRTWNEARASWGAAANKEMWKRSVEALCSFMYVRATRHEGDHEMGDGNSNAICIVSQRYRCQYRTLWCDCFTRNDTLVIVVTYRSLSSIANRREHVGLLCVCHYPTTCPPRQLTNIRTLRV